MKFKQKLFVVWGRVKVLWGWVRKSRRNTIIAVIVSAVTVTGTVLFVRFVLPTLIIIVFLVLLYFGERIDEAIQAGWSKAAVGGIEAARSMTEILTTVHAEIGIKKPYDIYAVWQEPTEKDGKTLHHAKATQSEKAQLDTDSLDEYRAIINGRAAEIGTPLMVTAIHPRGRHFIYDVIVTGDILNYVSPNDLAVDRDF